MAFYARRPPYWGHVRQLTLSCDTCGISGTFLMISNKIRAKIDISSVEIGGRGDGQCCAFSVALT